MKGNYYHRQYERERTITNAIAIVGRARAKDRAIKIEQRTYAKER